MTISDYQISAVIRTYMKHMKMKLKPKEKVPTHEASEDRVIISEEAMKKVLFERIGDKMVEMVRKHEPEK
ncbi:MAG: hypothetical protein N2513_01520 [Deltaproteobacteria bacterium]|nr:hypothetical protein [Deltaproteobacteria bacterium]